MNSFERLMRPPQKENIVFALSGAFCDKGNAPLQWELRQMSEKERVWLATRKYDIGSVLQTLAKTLIRPVPHGKEQLARLAAECGRPIKNSTEALAALLTWAELQTLMLVFWRHNDLGTPFWALAGQLAGHIEEQQGTLAHRMHLALQNHNISPREYLKLTEQEQAFIAASDMIRIKELRQGPKNAVPRKNRLRRNQNERLL